MPHTRSWVVLLSLTGSGALASGCQKGRGTEWVKEEKARVTHLPATFGRATDCPDGLARCVGGTVEASTLARIPLPCSTTESPNQCDCPWKAVAECARGCAVEGAKVVVSADRAAIRLCAPDPANPATRPAPNAVAPPGACGGELEGGGYRCTASLVVACDSASDGGASSARVAAACIRGCAREGEVVDEDSADDPAGVSRILCAP